MGRRRRRRTRFDDDRAGYDRLDSWELVHNTYTVEGRIEQTARFARGVRRARGRNRVAGYVMFGILAAPILVSLVLSVLLLVR